MTVVCKAPNLKPDYTLWNDPDTNAETALCLAFGVNPAAFRYVLDIQKKYLNRYDTGIIPYPSVPERDSIEKEDAEFWNAFGDHCLNGAWGSEMSTYQALRDIKSCIHPAYWSGDKKSFTRKLYAVGLQMAGGGRAKPSSDFVAFLKEKGEWYNDMDHYESNLKQFLIDPASCDLSILSGPIETMAVLHGLEPERFRKFFDIYEAMNGVSKPRPTDDDLAFFFAYRQGVKASTAVYMNTRRVMGVHPEWPGDAALYLCETYKEMGVIFPQSKLIDRLYPDGLKYEENSRIMKFYRSQVDEKLWTLDQAVQAFIGNGRFSALGMRDLREQDGHIEHAEKDSNEWKYACPNEKGYKSLDELADKHTQSGELKHEGKNSAGAYYYRPDVIIRWISKMTGLEPVPVLKQALSKTVSKNFSGKANEAKHRTIYEQYHNDQIDLFMAGKISWPSRDQNSEQPIIEDLMKSSNLVFNREAFRKVRKEATAYLKDFGKTRKSQKNIDDLKAFYNKQKEAA